MPNGDAFDIYTTAIQSGLHYRGMAEYANTNNREVLLAWYTEGSIYLNANDPPKVVCIINEGSYGSDPNKAGLSVR